MAKAVKHYGLGGTVRRENGAYHQTLDSAFNAGRDAAIAGLPYPKALPDVLPNLRQEWRRGYKSIRGEV